jgi:two-component system nitrogen regulation response regulator GlnG
MTKRRFAGRCDVLLNAAAEEGIDAARRQRPDVVFLDVRLPGMDGLEALQLLRDLTDDAPIIVMTAHGNLSTAVRAVEGGAFDYLAKPFDLDQALALVQRALNRSERPTAAATPQMPGEEIVGQSLPLQQVFRQIALVAPRESCVLITGESGTGKELVARAIHRHSQRRAKPFIPVHVAALNPNLVESELFGHVKGAFTGAATARPGLLALADGGTVFLDEVADIPLGVQAKLLRVLEFNEVMPVGGNLAQPLQLRILSATHRNLQHEVTEGNFRHDLYFRLNGFQITLPPLRERGDDVLALAEHFLHRIEPRSLPLTPATAEMLKSRPWPGNVRELRHALEHAAILARGGPIQPEHFPAMGLAPQHNPLGDLETIVRDWVDRQVAAAGKAEPSGLHDALLASIEPLLIKEVLERLHGNRLAASRWLGLARATVRKLIAKYFPSEESDGEDDADNLT